MCRFGRDAFAYSVFWRLRSSGTAVGSGGTSTECQVVGQFENDPARLGGGVALAVEADHGGRRLPRLL